MGGAVAGQVKAGGGLTFLAVEGAGHMVPMDQPANVRAPIITVINTMGMRPGPGERILVSYYGCRLCPSCRRTLMLSVITMIHSHTHTHTHTRSMSQSHIIICTVLITVIGHTGSLDS